MNFKPTYLQYGKESAIKRKPPHIAGREFVQKPVLAN